MSQDKKKRIEVSAIGTKGMLVRISDKTFFRVTKINGSTVDYKMTHHDLMVEITDSNAFFNQDEIVMIQDNKKTTLPPALGTKGMIIQGMGEFEFRVKKSVDDFTDYKLPNHDLMVEIIDSDAAFYQDENGVGICLDYPSRVYGRKKV